MTRDATIARTARRQITHEGTDIDIKTKTEGTESEYGETIDTTNTTTTQAILPAPSKQHDPSFFGMADTDISAEVWVSDTVSVDDGGGILASEIDIDQDGTFEYVVETAVDQRNGIQALACTNREE